MNPCAIVRTHPARRERGAALIVTFVTLFIASVACALLALTARTVHARAQAQTAADAAALAAAYDGVDAATRVAGANGAQIVTFVDGEDAVTVTVSRAGVHASARATRGECRGSCASIP